MLNTDEKLMKAQIEAMKDAIREEEKYGCPETESPARDVLVKFLNENFKEIELTETNKNLFLLYLKNKKDKIKPEWDFTYFVRYLCKTVQYKDFILEFLADNNYCWNRSILKLTNFLMQF